MFYLLSVNPLLEAINRLAVANRTGRLVDRVILDITSFDITAVWHRVDIISQFYFNRIFKLFCKIVA